MLLTKVHISLSNHLKNDFVFCTKIIQVSNNNVRKSYFSEMTENTANIRRGTGGRSSFSGVVATVFGASGFFGKYLVNQLGKIGSQVIIPYRGTSYAVRELRVLGDLGQVLFLPLNIKDDESIRKAIKYSNVVVNLIGKDTETKNFSHESVHVDIAGRIARLSKEMGVEKLVHVSALNASPSIKPFIKKSGSSFLRTKGYGEIEVKREFPEAVIFRPSDMYGHIDRFLIYYYRTERRYNFMKRTMIPLWKCGQETIKQPVYAGDVARGMINAITDPTIQRCIFEAAGPYRYRLDHLVWWILMTLRYNQLNTKIIDINPLMKLKIKFFEKVKPIYPPVSMEKLERECVTDELSGLPTLEDLGISLTALEDRIHYELRYLRKGNHYWEALNEFPDVPAPPKAVY